MTCAAPAFLCAPEAQADLDNWELLIAAILHEAAELRSVDRAALAARIVALGGYESPDNPAACNARAQLALRLAARLANAA